MKRIIIKISAISLALITVLSLFASCSGDPRESFEPERFEFTVRNPLQKEGFADGYYYVENDDGTITVTSADVSGDVSVPAEIAGKKVVAIGDGAFFENKSISSVTLPETVESIGIYAFSDCSELRSFSATSSLWRVAPFAFDNTPWLSSQSEEFVTVGDGVLIAYNGTSRTPVLPDSVRHLGGAFAGSDTLYSLTLGRGVLSISENALSYCANLKSIDFGLSLAYVGAQAFAGSENIQSLVFPDTLKYIGAEACINCYLIKYIYLGQSITEIGRSAFEYCQALRTVYLPSSLQSIKTSQFADCYSLCLILYGGTEAEFNAIAANDDVSSFKNINIIYEHTGGINE